MITITEKEYNRLKTFWNTMHKAQRKWASKNREKLTVYMREYRKKQKVDNENNNGIVETDGEK